jgi:hypothetical protein
MNDLQPKKEKKRNLPGVYFHTFINISIKGRDSHFDITIAFTMLILIVSKTSRIFFYRPII